MTEKKKVKSSWSQAFLTIIIFILVCLAIIGFAKLFFEPVPKCFIYSGNNATEYPCGEIEEFCDNIGCARSYGSCGKPLCICEVLK